MNLYRITGIVFLLIIVWGCKQEISIKKSGFTAINSLSYTGVVYQTKRDTVFTSTFDGKIYQIINGESQRKQIVAINDEIYDIAFNARENHIYAATLNSGIVIIDIKKGYVIKELPLKETWAKELVYNLHTGILCTYDFKGNHYIWDTRENFKLLSTPEELKKLRPKFINDNGAIYFDGKGAVVVWNYKNNTILDSSKIGGELMDVDENRNYMLLSGKEFSYYNKKMDSLLFKQKHPNWPIYVADKDTTVNVPLSLEIISGLMTTNNIFTLGLDKSFRKWDKHSGELLKTYTLYQNTPTAMDLAEDESQLVIVDLGGAIKFQEL
ncbi:hypothetical protein [Galbibacter orientalis]|uniref:hypothetical protein n=1 Tax=Galbibacter orientalis TaxID=453852 RepID=UPI0030802ECD